MTEYNLGNPKSTVQVGNNRNNTDLCGMDLRLSYAQQAESHTKYLRRMLT